MQSVVTIDKLKIKDGLPTISFSAADAKGKKYSVPGAEYTDPVHRDLQKRLDAFNVHLALSTSMLPIPAEIKDIDEEVLSYYHMHGISLKSDGVTLSGHKILPNGKAFNFNSPFIRFAESEETQYTFVEHLAEDLEALEKEVRSYIDGSKRADEAQLNLFEPPREETTNKAQILPPDKKEDVFMVEGPGGIIELPILPENGTIADVDTSLKVMNETHGGKSEKPFERPLMDDFEDEKPIKSTSNIDKEGLTKAVTNSRKRTSQTAENKSGLPNENE